MSESLEVEKLKMDYAKSVSTLFMAICGGQITLAGTIFKNANYFSWALVAIILMMLASLTALSLAEGVMRRVSGPPNFKSKIALFFCGGSNSLEIDYIKGFIGAVLFALSISAFMIYVYKVLG